MTTYFIRIRGTKTVRSVMADSYKQAQLKFLRAIGVANPILALGYTQQVFKCDYQDMQGEVIK